jgi:Na+/melibiose symporter-like transporter
MTIQHGLLGVILLLSVALVLLVPRFNRFADERILQFLVGIALGAVAYAILYVLGADSQ